MVSAGPAHVTGLTPNFGSKYTVFMGFPGDSLSKESACHAGDLGSIPGLGRSPGEGKGYPLQYSYLENYIDCKSMGSQRVGHDSNFHSLDTS